MNIETVATLVLSLASAGGFTRDETRSFIVSEIDRLKKDESRRK